MLESAPRFDVEAPEVRVGFEPVAFGQYQLIRRIARGGMAEIFLAVERGMGGIEREVVVKRILPQMSEEEDFVTMFMDEARVSARLTHPNIAHIYNFGEVDGICFLAMEHVDGLTLSRLRRQSEPQRIPLGHALRIVSDVCAGLHAAHDARDPEGNLLGVVHRDVSPQNIMISRDGVTKLLDFGVARAATQAHATKAGQIKGKLGYIPPEQYRGQHIDRRADLFGVGAVLYEMLTGLRTFVRENEAATMHAILLDEPPPIPAELGVPPEVEALLRSAVAKDPAARPPTALAMQAELERIAASHGVVVTPFLLGQFVVERMERVGVARDDGSTPSGRSPALGKPVPELYEEPSSAESEGREEVDDDAPTLVSEPSQASEPSVTSQPSGVSSPSSAPASIETPGPAWDVPGRRSRLPAVAAVVAAAVLLGSAGAVGLWLHFGARDDGPARAAVAPHREPDPGPTAPTPGLGALPALADAAPAAPLAPGLAEAGPDAATGLPSAADAGATTADGAAEPLELEASDAGRGEPAPPPPGTGRLFLHTTPWSKVRAGRRSLGTTPILGAELPAGAHTLELVDPEGRTHRKVVRIRPGRATKVYLTLIPPSE